MNKQAYETAVGRVLSKKAVDWSSVWESIKSGSGKAYDALKKNIQENPAAYIGGAGGALIGAGTGAAMKGLRGGAIGGATGALLGALGGAGVDKYRAYVTAERSRRMAAQAAEQEKMKREKEYADKISQAVSEFGDEEAELYKNKLMSLKDNPSEAQKVFDYLTGRLAERAARGETAKLFQEIDQKYPIESNIGTEFSFKDIFGVRGLYNKIKNK